MSKNTILQSAAAPRAWPHREIESEGDPAEPASTPAVALPILIENREVQFSARAFRCAETGTEALCLFSLEGSDSVTEVPLVRVHSGCVTGDIFHSLRCDCHEQLQRALAAIANAPFGLLIYLPSHEGRGIGLYQKMRAYGLQERGFDTVDANTAIGKAVDERDFSFAASILKSLGIARIGLLTNNPAKAAALEACGITIAARVSIEIESNPHNHRYLRTKRDRLSHAIRVNGSSAPTAGNSSMAELQKNAAASANVARFSTKASGRGAFASTEEIISEFRNGRMVVLVDAEDRENEGDLIVPAQMATPEAINFMATHGRGLICLALTPARAQELQLEFMVRRNESRNRTAFTQSIEAREGISTGISASDRARTIATAIDPTRSASDLVSPGHVFPLIAREGGVLVRAGHTEASVDLARLAGLLPSAVICEIMNEDGTMARVPDLLPFAQRHGLKIGTIEDLIAYRLRNDCLVREVAETEIDSAFGGAFKLKVFSTSVEPTEHLALIKGDIATPGPVLVRVHDVSAMGDLLGVGAEAGTDPQIAKAMQLIGNEGRGVLVLIRNPDPRSISSWINRRMRQAPAKGTGRELRQVETGIGSQILRHLKVREMTLLTNSSSHNYVGIEAFGLAIAGVRRLDAIAAGPAS